MKIYEIQTKYVMVGCAKYLKKIQSPDDMNQYMKNAFDDHIDQEQFWVILLNTENIPIARYMITLGLVNQTQIHAREAFRFAIRENAVAVVFAHNHPSGVAFPSKEDIIITKNLITTLDLIGSHLIDHIIVADNDCISLAESELTGSIFYLKDD